MSQGGEIQKLSHKHSICELLPYAHLDCPRSELFNKNIHFY